MVSLSVYPSGQEFNLEEMNMPRTLTSYEQETIINFNKAEDIAYIFTYEKTWQQHLEKKLGLKPVMNNGHGGKEYVLPKSRIKPPRAPKQLSAEAREELTERLHRTVFLALKTPILWGNLKLKRRTRVIPYPQVRRGRN